MRKLHLLNVVSTCMLTLGTLTAAQANLVFEDDFSSGVLPAGWVTVHGTQWIENEWLHTQGSGLPRDSLGLLHDGNKTWRDYIFKVTFDPLEGPESQWTNGAIIFRSDGFDRSSAGQFGNGYIMTFSNVVAPGVRGDGPVNVIGLNRIDENGQVGLARADGNWGSDPFEMIIKAVGPNLTITMNGETLFDVVDPDPLRYGGIGVHAIWEAESRYDNMSVNLVPIPAAVWLFGSGLIGLVGLARRNS